VLSAKRLAAVFLHSKEGSRPKDGTGLSGRVLPGQRHRNPATSLEGAGFLRL